MMLGSSSPDCTVAGGGAALKADKADKALLIWSTPSGGSLAPAASSGDLGLGSCGGCWTGTSTAAAVCLPVCLTSSCWLCGLSQMCRPCWAAGSRVAPDCPAPAVGRSDLQVVPGQSHCCDDILGPQMADGSEQCAEFCLAFSQDGLQTASRHLLLGSAAPVVLSCSSPAAPCTACTATAVGCL